MVYIRFYKLPPNTTLQKDPLCRNYIHLNKNTCPMKGPVRPFISNSAAVYLALEVLIELLFIYAADISACWVPLASTVGTWHRGRGGGGGGAPYLQFHVSFLAEKGCSMYHKCIDIVHDKDDEFSRSRCLF
jgi:hypothetical protein